MKIKKIVLDTLVIILITCLLLAVIEVVLRISFPELKNYRRTPSHSLAYEFNKDYLVALKPNVTKEFRIKGGKEFGKVVTWKSNSHGFRGPEIGEKKGLRVIVYGDSNMQARFSDYQDTYPAVLQKLLRKKIKDTQVINAGIVGGGPDENLIRIKQDYNSVKPDIVILEITVGNDYGDIIRDRLFKLSKTGELVKTNFPVTVDKKLPSLEKNLVYSLRHLYIQGLINYLGIKNKESQESKLSKQEKITKLLNEHLYANKLAFDIYKNDKPREFSHFEDFDDIDVSTDPESESAQTKIALMDKIILDAKKFCDEHNVKFILLVVPIRADLVASVDTSYIEMAKRYKNYKATNLTDPLKELCTAHHLECIHLIDSFRKNKPESLYRYDNHWSNNGQQLAAEETLKQLIALLPSPELN